MKIGVLAAQEAFAEQIAAFRLEVEAR